MRLNVNVFGYENPIYVSKEKFNSQMNLNY